MKYRIKIEEKYNGEKEYVPQVRVGGFFTGQWENLVVRWHGKTISLLGKAMEEPYASFDEAQKIIDQHKKQIEEERLEKVKTIKYKNL